MRIAYETIGAAFPGNAWAYAESLDAVRIGRWHGANLVFYDALDENLLLTLRIFDETRELTFSGDKCRDTDIYPNGECIRALADAAYAMRGTRAQIVGEYTKLWEERGGVLYFPAKLSFPDGETALKLGIKNFVRYHPVPVCPKGKAYEEALDPSGAGALEVVDYAYTGFYYANGKAVAL